MSTFRISILSFLLLCGALPLFGQEFLGAFHIRQKEFREENDSVHLRFTLQVDSRAVPSCGAMIFEPELSDDDHHRLVFPYIQLTGADRARLNQRWFSICSDRWLDSYQTPYRQVGVNKYTTETFDYAFSMPYQRWMDHARLVLRQEVIDCAGELYLYTYTLTDYIDISSRQPYPVSPLVALATPTDEPKSRSRQGSAFLDFQANRSVILPDFRRNPVELGKIDDALQDVVDNTDVRITGIFIEGYASPEGSYKNNERLAHERAIALREYIRTHHLFAGDLFTVRSVAEDWDGLRLRVESNGDLPRREDILSVIDSSDQPDVKEQRLKALNVYPRLLRDLFPELRRVEYQIDYAVRSYSDTEARLLIHSAPENLSHAELYRLANSYGRDSDDYRRILTEVIPKYYEHDAVALNNAAALLIGNGELNTALRLLEKARDLPAAWNNRGVVYLLQGLYDQAGALFDQASLAGVVEASHNQSELAVKLADDAQRARK